MKNSFLFFPLTAGVRNIGLAFLAAMALVLTGCGGGGGGDGSGDGDSFETASFNEEAAVIDGEDDAKTSAVAARESAQQAILEDEQPDQGSFPTGITVAASGTEFPVYDISLNLIEVAVLPTAAENSVPGDCGGKAVVNVSDDGSEYRIDYQDYCTSYDGEKYVIDGYYDWGNFNDSANYQMRFDYEVSYLGETYRSKGTYKCTDGVCAYQNYFVGTDGRQYRTENVSVTTGSGGSYSVSARVYDQDMGYIEYTSSGLVLCDSGIGFSDGEITVTDDSGNTVTVTFAGCSSYTVTYNGGASYTVDYKN